MDKIELLEVLNSWNYWNRDLPQTFSRNIYDDKIDSFIKSGEITVLKGIRRSGKSTLMINQIKRLVNSGVESKNILFVNLEDPRFLSHLDLELLENIKNTYLEALDPDMKPYIFLDEIQNIPNWEKWVNKEYELKLSNVIVTGSNSAMLSKEIASTLSGRYLSAEIYPLGFKEFLFFHGIEISSTLDFVNRKITISREFEKFIKDGGFPRVINYDDDKKNELLTTYKDTMLLKDIVARFQLKSYTTLEEISAFILSNSGILQSVSKIKNNFNISHDMAKDYLEYLQKAYMIYEIKKFDYSLKKQNANEKKYYSCDLGLSNILRVPNLQTRGSDLETIVFLELLRRGYKVYYYKTSNNLECDFIIEKNSKIEKLVQVTKSLKDEKTLKRELRVFAKVIDELKLSEIENIVICEDNSSTIQYDNQSIKIINILEWLTF